MTHIKRKPLAVEVTISDGPPLDLGEWARRYVDAILEAEGFPPPPAQEPRA